MRYVIMTYRNGVAEPQMGFRRKRDAEFFLKVAINACTSGNLPFIKIAE